MIREPEWDDEQVARLLALGFYEAGVCSGCGFHESLTSDLSNHFTFSESTCNTCRGSAQYGRKLSELDKREAEIMAKAPPLTPRASDGRKVYMRLMSEGEVTERRERRASRKE